MPRKMKDGPMNSQVSFQTPTAADVDRLIAQAHQMRSDFIAQSVRAGLARLRDIFPKNALGGKASA